MVEARMLAFLLLSLRFLLAKATSSGDDLEDGVVEDEATSPEGLPGFPGGKIPTAEELLGMLDSLTGISDEDKEKLRRDLLKQTKGGGGFPEEPPAQMASSFFASQFFILLASLSVLTLIFVFFGYKLYKSLSERERKREEKKKIKQMKKKK